MRVRSGLSDSTQEHVVLNWPITRALQTHAEMRVLFKFFTHFGKPFFREFVTYTERVLRFVCLFPLQEKMERNSRKRSAPARLREGKQLDWIVFMKAQSDRQACMLSDQWKELFTDQSIQEQVSMIVIRKSMPVYYVKAVSTCTLVVYNFCQTIKFIQKDSLVLLHAYRPCISNIWRQRKDNLYSLCTYQLPKFPWNMFK